jgi:hypothetical protein
LFWKAGAMQFMTHEVFDTIIVVVIIIGLALAVVRLYADFTRPLPPEEPEFEEDDTRPNRPVGG